MSAGKCPMGQFLGVSHGTALSWVVWDIWDKRDTWDRFCRAAQGLN